MFNNPYNNFNNNFNGQNNGVGNPYNAYNMGQNTNIIYANGEYDVQSRVLPPDGDYLFADNNDNSIVYRKTINRKGQFEVNTYKKVSNLTPESEVKPQSIDLSSYAKKDELGAIQSKLDVLEGKLATLIEQSKKSVEVKSNGTKQG